MHKKMLIAVVSLIFLSGCATMGRKQDGEVQQLQSRVNALEIELERKNHEIEGLENELESRTTRSVSRSETEEVSGDTVRLSKKQAQEALKNAGFYDGPIDGKVGPKTKDAIMAFQKENGLKVDGVVGRKTSVELKRYLTE